MGWRDTLREDDRRRIEQIEAYEETFGYKADSDQFLIWSLVKELDRQNDMFDLWRKRYTPWWLRIVQNRSRHAYTCRFFKRIDFLILWFRGKHPYWKNGRLFIGRMEADTIFPVSWYMRAAEMQNQKVWTRLILDL